MWKPQDYILKGEYCDKFDLRQQTERIAGSESAEGAILLVTNRKMFFQSLTVAVHKNKKIEDALQLSMIEEQYKQAPSGFPNHNQTMSLSKTFHAVRNEKPFYRLMTILDGKIQIKTLRNNESIINDSEIPRGIYASTYVFIISPKSHTTSDSTIDLLNELSAMTNACAPVLVNHSLFIARTVDDALDSAEEKHAREDQEQDRLSLRLGHSDDAFHKYASMLLEVAVRLTDSTIGNFYTATSDSQKLKLIADIKNENPIELIDVDHQKSVVAHVYQRKRPLIINDIDEFKRTHPRIEYRWVGRDKATSPYAELAVPVLQRNLQSKYFTVFGVINVEKVKPNNSGIYTDDDLAILRQIALRFCLWRSRTIFSLSSKSLANLTTRNLISDQPPNPTLIATSGTSIDVPPEAIVARDRIREALKAAYEFTRSSVATVRLVAIDNVNATRFLAIPYEALDHPQRQIPLRADDSIVSWTIRSGETCYLPNVREENAFRSYPGLNGYRDIHNGSAPSLTSECCLPLFVSGRAVGALNLESSYSDAYADTLPFLRAIAEQIGLSILLARRSIEQIVYSMGASTALNLHQLLQCSSKLGDISRQSSDPLASSIDKIKTTMDNALNPRRSKSNDDKNSNVSDIVYNIIDDLNFHQRVKVHPNNLSLSQLKPQISSALLLSLREVILNAYREGISSERGGVDVYFSGSYLGGKRYVSVKIVNETFSKSLADLLCQLYRLPISRKDRMHIGAFQAGALIRSIGGDVYARLSKDRKSITTTFEVPIDLE